jgi:hypothetical protein
VPQDPIPVIPPPLSEGPCTTWELADWWLDGFVEGSALFGQEELAIPAYLVSLGSKGIHWELCAPY